MAGFTDSSYTYMRAATIPTGGLKIEAGCWTQGAAASAHIPTQLTTCIALVCGSEGATAVPCISNGFISCALAASSATKVQNYIAVGW